MKLGKIKFVLKKHSPKIFLVGGVLMVGAGTALACKAYKETEVIVDDHRGALEVIDAEMSTQENTKRLKVAAYTETACRLTKVWSGAVILWGAGMVCVINSNRILSKRNAALGSAVMMYKKKVDTIERNLIAEKGEEFAKRMLYGGEKREIEYTEEEENGDVHAKKKKETVVDPSDLYGRAFSSETSRCWTRNNMLNMSFLETQQRIANQRLVAQGYLFLNEVYESLGMAPTQAGQIVGWVYEPDNLRRENCVDFGMYDVFGNVNENMEGMILLDFNVDGPVFDPMLDDTMLTPLSRY